jgi:hypothetical protein
MRRGRWVALAVMISSSVASAEPSLLDYHYPPDIETFIARVAMCAQASKDHKVLPPKVWGCDRLVEDRTRLAARYHENLKLVQALSYHWHFRLPPVPAMHPVP